MANLSDLGLVPSDAAPPDAILMARVERFIDLRPHVMADLSNRPALEEYHALRQTVGDTKAATPEGARAKLEAALDTLGADRKGWRGTIWELPILAIQDASQVGVAALPAMGKVAQ